MLKLMARGLLSVLIVLSLLFAAAGPIVANDGSMNHSAIPMASNKMDCPACVLVAHSASVSVCAELPCFNLAETAEIVSPTLDYCTLHAVSSGQLPEGLAFKPPTPPV